jgi:uncharacterized protein (TIGR02001 family)
MAELLNPWACAFFIVALLVAASPPTHAEASDKTPANSISVSGRGGPAAEPAAQPTVAQEDEASIVEFSARAGIASDYIYRGTTLSDRKPAVGGGIEAALGRFYVGATATTVDLPTNPPVELAFSAGVRPKLGKVDFDIGWASYVYPSETSDTDYGEAIIRAETRIRDKFGIAGGFAYSPNVSNTGAWSKYVALGIGAELPESALPRNVTATLTTTVGYSMFGNQSTALGGYPLPAYLNWSAGIRLTRGKLNLDLRYHDTNLSRENCYILTGDPGATPGGRPDPVTNPAGLVSGWCSPTLVAKLWFTVD